MNTTPPPKCSLIALSAISMPVSACRRVTMVDAVCDRWSPSVSSAYHVSVAVRVASRRVVQAQVHQLDRRVRRHRHRQHAVPLVGGVLPAGAALRMSNDVARARRPGRRRERPRAVGGAVVQEDGFGGGIGHRVVGPRRQPARLAVVDPRAARSRFGDQAAEGRIGQHVRPRRRRPARRRRRPARTRGRRARSRRGRWRARRSDGHLGAVGARRRGCRVPGRRRRAFSRAGQRRRRTRHLQLVGQRPARGHQHRARHGAQRDRVVGRQRVGPPQEHAGRACRASLPTGWPR